MTDTALTKSEPLDLMRSLEKGVAEGTLSVEVVERLVALQERQEERRAQSALIAALHRFQATCPDIEKTTPVHTKSGQLAYKYAKFEDVKRAILPALKACGLMFSHTVESDRVVCRVSHADGAFTESSYPLSNWEGTQLQNSMQRAASAISYAKRYSLIGALGIATEDDDGRGADKPVTKADLKDLYDRYCAKYGGGDNATVRFRDWLRNTAFNGERNDDDLRNPESWTQEDVQYVRGVLSRMTFDDFAPTERSGQAKQQSHEMDKPPSEFDFEADT